MCQMVLASHIWFTGGQTSCASAQGRPTSGSQLVKFLHMTFVPSNHIPQSSSLSICQCSFMCFSSCLISRTVEYLSATDIRKDLYVIQKALTVISKWWCLPYSVVKTPADKVKRKTWLTAYPRAISPFFQFYLGRELAPGRTSAPSSKGCELIASRWPPFFFLVIGLGVWGWQMSKQWYPTSVKRGANYQIEVGHSFKIRSHYIPLGDIISLVKLGFSSGCT